MTHLLPGGGVPRVHGARSPVPPRLPLSATPRSVCHLATIVAGAYPLRNPPNVWSPGLPAPPGPCYWLVASGTLLGWRGGCLAVGLVRATVCHYCLGNAVPWWCVRSTRGRSGGLGPVPVPASPPCPRPFPCVLRAACGGLHHPVVPYARPPVRLSMRSVRSAGSIWLPPSFAPRLRCVCVRSHSCSVRALRPCPGRCGARTLRGSGAGRP